MLNINDWDPRFKYPQYEFYVPEKDKKVGHIVGKLEVHDGDEGDSVTLELKGSFARVFTINKKGQLIIQDLRYATICFLLILLENVIVRHIFLLYILSKYSFYCTAI